MNERRYGEREVAFILERAARAGHTRALRPGEPQGLTLAQLKDIGHEVGISAGAIEDAALALEQSSSERPVPLLGTPVAPQYEKWIRYEIRPEDREDVLLAIRRRMGRHGIVEQTPRGFDWRARDALGGRYITVESREDRTVVRGLGNFRDGAGAVFTITGTAAGLTALGILKGVGLLSVLGLGTLPVVLAAAYVPARLVWKWRYRAENETLRATVADIARMLESRHPVTGDTEASGGDRAAVEE
ncbi:MAG: hypothetical protein L0271_12190 [Gemmatimonadetes bacterium]|nr:hypothetical protein [Gemmatimonadota bacterium]